MKSRPTINELLGIPSDRYPKRPTPAPILNPATFHYTPSVETDLRKSFERIRCDSPTPPLPKGYFSIIPGGKPR